MRMAMMQIGIMRVFVPQGGVAVPVRMRLADRAIMVMLMVLVMHMRMFVLQRFVDVLMVMAFGKMQPQPDRHQQAGTDQLDGHRFAKQGERQDSADEGRQ